MKKSITIDARERTNEQTLANIEAISSHEFNNEYEFDLCVLLRSSSLGVISTEGTVNEVREYARNIHQRGLIIGAI